jgi:uncharacterized protein YcbX
MPVQPRVASLHPFPVTSMLGEQVAVLDVDERGCVGDRSWSVVTAAGKIGSGKSTRRFAAVPGLLAVRAAERDGVVLVTFPDGTTCPVHDAEAAARLSRHLGQPVTLARETRSVTSTTGRSACSDVPPSQRWPRVRIGSAVLHVTAASPRCVMVNAATADLPAQPGNLAPPPRRQLRLKPQVVTAAAQTSSSC